MKRELSPEAGRWCRCGTELQPKQRTYCSIRCGKDGTRDRYLQATYGITLEMWQQLLEFQGGGCAICGRPPTGKRVLVVDHEHNGGPSGKVRGLLCSVPCNLRIVAKHKSGDQLRRAADYLDHPPAEKLFGHVVAPGRKPKKRKMTRKGRK